MKILYDNEQYYAFLSDCLKAKPRSVKISSYGIWAGIMPDGTDLSHRFENESRDFLDSLVDVENVNIIIGVHNYIPCKTPFCGDCLKKYSNGVLRIISHANKFDGFKWKMTICHHLKCVIFDYGVDKIAVTGGRNLTNSSWADLSFSVKGKDALKLDDYFDTLWPEAMDVGDEAVAEVFKSQQISQNAILKAMNQQ